VIADPLLLPLAEAALACYAAGAVPTWQNAATTVHVFQSTVGGLPCFAFEGTVDLAEWVIDFDAVETWVTNHPQIGIVHTGLLQTSQAAVDGFILPTLVALGYPKFYVTGHSKGAGEAILATALLKAGSCPPLAVRAFEPPRVGGSTLRDYLADIDGAWTRTSNAEGWDIVTSVPFGPTWDHPWDVRRVLLTVPDAYDIPTKHRMPAVLAAIQARSPG
jgi:hypothetical protein